MVNNTWWTTELIGNYRTRDNGIEEKRELAKIRGSNFDDNDCGNLQRQRFDNTQLTKQTQICLIMSVTKRERVKR